LKGFLSGASTHTAMPTDDGKTLIVAEERANGNVKIYDISNINSPNDPDAPVLKATLNAANVCHLGTCISAHSPHHVHVHGNLMFLPWYEAGLQVFNISNPASPVLVGAFDTYPGTSTSFNGNWGVDLSMGLKRVLLSDRSRGLLVVDASAVVIPGDYNQDMVVNAADYDVWRSTFGTTRSSAHDAPYADGNYDGIVNAADYVVWRNNFGQIQSGFAVGSGLAAVPEPASLVLLLMGVGMMSRRRSRAA
jgi:PEP-CTERM motif/LVIVD repeat